MQSLLEDYISIIDIDVAWGEMDAAQHVNNIVFLRYAESGRLDYFTKLGFQVNTSGKGEAIGPILAEANCKYKMPLTYPDKVSVGTKVEIDSIDDYSFWLKQIVLSHKKQRIAAEIKTKIVSYDYEKLQKAVIPNFFLEKISNKDDI